MPPATSRDKATGVLHTLRNLFVPTPTLTNQLSDYFVD
jgi:hypothetical protein